MNVSPTVVELINNAAHLEAKDFDVFFKKMMTLRAQRTVPTLPSAESDLLKKINKGFAEKKWQRLHLLNEKMEETLLTSLEQAELAELIEAYEKYMVKRLQYLAQLATLRNVPLQNLMKTLDIAPKGHG